MDNLTNWARMQINKFVTWLQELSIVLRGVVVNIFGLLLIFPVFPYLLDGTFAIHPVLFLLTYAVFLAFTIAAIQKGLSMFHDSLSHYSENRIPDEIEDKSLSFFERVSEARKDFKSSVENKKPLSDYDTDPAPNVAYIGEAIIATLIMLAIFLLMIGILQVLGLYSSAIEYLNSVEVNGDNPAITIFASEFRLLSIFYPSFMTGLSTANQLLIGYLIYAPAFFLITAAKNVLEIIEKTNVAIIIRVKKTLGYEIIGTALLAIFYPLFYAVASLPYLG